METFYSLPFAVLEVPYLKLKRPSWFKKPSAMVVYAIVLVSYFMVCGGIYLIFEQFYNVTSLMEFKDLLFNFYIDIRRYPIFWF